MQPYLLFKRRITHFRYGVHKRLPNFSFIQIIRILLVLFILFAQTNYYVTEVHAAIGESGNIPTDPNLSWPFAHSAGNQLTSEFQTTNTPPYVPYDPSPSDGASGVDPRCPTLSWTGGDPDGDDVTYDVYINGAIASSNQSDTNFTPFCGPFPEFGVAFTWNIVATDSHSSTTNGPIWTFTTETQAILSDPIPADGATDVNIHPTLNWSELYALTYVIYLDTVNPPVQQVGTSDAAKYVPSTLNRGVTYYWRVIALTSQYDPPITGPVWSFKTSGKYIDLFPVIIK